MSQFNVEILNLNEEWSEKAKKELNETAETRNLKIIELKERIKTKGGLVKQTDDEFLLKFLRAKKFDVLKAFNMMERHQVITKAYPELFDLTKAASNLNIFKIQGQNMLDGRDRNGAKIFLYKVGRFKISQNPSEGEVTVEDIFRSNILCLEWCLLEPETQIGGITVLADMSNFSITSHGSLLSPHHSRRTIEVMQVFLHGTNSKSLHQYISPEVLPKEYGGMLPDADNSIWRLRLEKDISLIL